VLFFVGSPPPPPSSHHQISLLSHVFLLINKCSGWQGDFASPCRVIQGVILCWVDREPILVIHFSLNPCTFSPMEQEGSFNTDETMK
jgi:hypothetical protein